MATITTTFSLPQHVNRIKRIESLSKFDIIIDVRAYNKFIISHLKNSINICLPSTLLKRKNFDLVRMMNCVDSTPTIRRIVTNVTQPMDNGRLSILIYDANSTDDNVGFNLYYTFEKFLNYRDNFELSYLEGGFDSFIGNRDIIEDSSGTPPSSPIKDHLKLSCFQLPSSKSPEEMFVSSLKKNALPKLDINSILKASKESDDILSGYQYKITLPEDFNNFKDEIPQWLQILTKSNNEIIQKLYQKFCKIERREQLRLKTVICKDKKCHSPSICTPTGLCPGCDEIKYVMPRGVEYGLKNRYQNIWPYEHSRVKLTDAPDDYFNANYIYNYIATQDPLRETQEDFWNIIRENKIGVVVCLNDNFGQNYYDGGKFNSFEVRIDNIEEKNGYTIRKLRLISESTPEHIVYHLKYKEWPDFGVPKNFDSLIELMRFKHKLIKVNNLNDKILVHCSAGCGRTGVFITVDHLIAELFNEVPDFWTNSDQIYKLINYQRTQRISMVQNFDQFIVCYELVAYFLILYLKKKKNNKTITPKHKIGIEGK